MRPSPNKADVIREELAMMMQETPLPWERRKDIRTVLVPRSDLEFNLQLQDLFQRLSELRQANEGLVAPPETDDSDSFDRFLKTTRQRFTRFSGSIVSEGKPN